MGDALIRRSISVSDYLEGELSSDIRHEYLGGDVYAMVGASDAHGLICGNVFAALHRHLRGGPCQVFIADMKVRLRIANEDFFYYPDILVSCDPTDRARYFRERPVVLIEVLSESTARVDSREKLFAYRHIDSLQDYVLIEQDKRGITIARRGDGWALQSFGPEGELRLPCLDFSMAVTQIYAGVES